MNIPRNFGAIIQAVKGEFDGGEVGAAGVDDGDFCHLSISILMNDIRLFHLNDKNYL